MAQTSTTGALTGTIFDPSGRVIPEVQVKITNVATGAVRTTVSKTDGTFNVPLLPPGSYSVEATRTGFKTSFSTGIVVRVTETAEVKVILEIGEVKQVVTVSAQAEMLEAESSVLGSVVGEREITDLPLVSRNFTQIIALSAGVNSEVTNATEPGLGTGGQAGGSGMFAHGAMDSDNNFEMDGVDSNDIQNSGSFSGGVAIANPDTIEEFKVQTGQYDASFGRNAGAQVSIVTKTGTNSVHGSAFGLLRDTVLNANDYITESVGGPKPTMNQSVFGGTLGGPIKKNKLTFFTSYQGNRQKNGYGGGLYGCSSTVYEPPFTNDRSAAALGSLFAGQRGVVQNLYGGVGPAIAADGSNINPVALAILQFKLPNGNLLIPTPQAIVNGEGISALSYACPFHDDQFMTNVDFLHTSKSTLTGRLFFDTSAITSTLPASPAPSILGSPVVGSSRFWNASISHTYVFDPNVVNRLIFGFHRINTLNQQAVPFHYSDVGATAPPTDDVQPLILILGSLGIGGTGQTLKIPQNTFALQDTLSYAHGRHNFAFGGGITRIQTDQEDFTGYGGAVFLSYPDFLLGLPAAQTDTPYSNIYESVDLPGLYGRAWRVLDADAYAQDNFRVTPRLTVNLGVRYERIGDFGDSLGRNSGFDGALADPNPPPDGTLAGYVVASNYPYSIPPGVTRASNQFAIQGIGQNTFSPRLGFAWQPPHTNRIVLRGGYGTYHSRSTAQSLAQSITSPPFGDLRFLVGPANGAASFQNPFQPQPAIPSFPLLVPGGDVTMRFLAPNFQPSLVQQFSLGLQADLGGNYLLQIASVESRGTKLYQTTYINEAYSASPADPIRGQTTNTVANILDRVPYQGLTPDGLTSVGSNGSSWYNDLEVSLNKRFSHGLQFLAAYTFSRAFSSSGGNVLNSAAGTAAPPGDQYGYRAGWGPAYFDREHRFVVSYIYQFPSARGMGFFGAKVLSGWSVSGVTVAQSGHPLTITNVNYNNAFGITEDRVELVPGCGSLATSGSATHRLNNYFNNNCFTNNYPVIGSDGIATGFGDSGVGIVTGPGQFNFDMSIVKNTNFKWPNEKASIQFRTDFFNAFNHPQFADPDTFYADLGSGFGDLASISVNPRIIQFGLKLSF
jgi:hypothetical protein